MIRHGFEGPKKMQMPISVNLLIAALGVLRGLCFAIAVLFLILAIKAQYDEAVVLGWGSATLMAAAFILGGTVCGVVRKAITNRAGNA